MSEVKLNYHQFDINLDGTVFAEEVYAVRRLHQFIIDLDKLIKSGKFNQEDVPDLMLSIISVTTKLKDDEQNNVAGISRPMQLSAISGLDPDVLKLINGLLAEYRQFSPQERVYLCAKFLEIQDAPSIEAMVLDAKQVLKDSSWILKNYVNMELMDGELGLSRSEFKNADLNTKVLSPKWQFPALADNGEVRKTVQWLKSCIQVDDPKTKVQLGKMLDALATIPSGKKLLQEVAHKYKDQKFVIRLLTDSEINLYPDAKAFGRFFRASQELGLNNAYLLDANDENLIAYASQLAHELLHPLISPQSEAEYHNTIAEEELCHELSQLVLWELGSFVTNGNLAAVTSPINRWFFLWNAYAPILYSGATADQVNQFEKGFSSPQWRNYINQQREWLMQAGLNACD